MKKAPNLKLQPKDKMTEVIIFAGSDAWCSAAIFLIPICISFDTDEKRR